MQIVGRTALLAAIVKPSVIRALGPNGLMLRLVP
jgi:hypothetical protein